VEIGVDFSDFGFPQQNFSVCQVYAFSVSVLKFLISLAFLLKEIH
jgi:hypothetical protein